MRFGGYKTINQIPFNQWFLDHFTPCIVYNLFKHLSSKCYSVFLRSVISPLFLFSVAELLKIKAEERYRGLQGTDMDKLMAQEVKLVMKPWQ